MKSARRGVWMDGYNAYENMYEPEHETESEALLLDAMYSPAWGNIWRFLESAKRLGFDPRDADIVRRAVRAGTETFESRPKPIPSVLGPVPAHDPLVYYMQLGSLLKIGTTTNIQVRMSNLNPERVLAVEPGDRTIESARHREFAAARHHGEWFTMTPELLRHVKAARERFEAESGLTLEAWLARPSLRRKPRFSSVLIPDASPTGQEAESSNPSAGSASADPS